MYAGYFALIAVMYPVFYFIFYALLGFTAFVLFKLATLLIKIRPLCCFEVIGVLDLRVYFNGEWYCIRELPPHAVQKLLDKPLISASL